MKIGAGCPPTPTFAWDVSPWFSLAPDLDLMGRALLLRARRLDFRLPDRGPRAARGVAGWREERVAAIRDPQEIDDEDHEQILERVCAIDVAKASGMVCTRVPHPSQPGKRRTRVWEVGSVVRSRSPAVPFLVKDARGGPESSNGQHQQRPRMNYMRVIWAYWQGCGR